jgi:hypothetical protein
MASKEIILIVSMLVCIVATFPTEYVVNNETLDGKVPYKYIIRATPRENIENSDSSKCLRYYEKLFVVSADTSNPTVIWSKIPAGYNYYINQDLNAGSGGICIN